MTDTISRSTAIDRMRDGLPCETNLQGHWRATDWPDFKATSVLFRIPPEPRREARGNVARRFTMFRRNVPTTTHDENQRNAPDEPQFEGVQFSDGRVCIRWLTAKRSVSVWDCMADMLAIHGHPEYGSEFVWHDDAPCVCGEHAECLSCDTDAVLKEAGHR